ncbi:MAG: helix-turn-helix transcriptional regulator [Lachnospiraceae bacterium]|nr:helix-turn-helix transcriptional regulator [Lachnospiraceae bacterium]
MVDLQILKQLAHGMAMQFGSDCEIVIHDLHSPDPEATVVYIENGHVSHRSVGAGFSHVVLEAKKAKPTSLKDRHGYLTRTGDARVLKSSTLYIKDETGEVRYIFSINYDITSMMVAENVLRSFTGITENGSGSEKRPDRITQNVNDLLDDLIEESVSLVGKPVAMMSKEDKALAVRFLNDSGAFLITKSGDKICDYFGISKYMLYTYLDAMKQDEAN